MYQGNYIGGIGAIPIEFWYVYFCTDHPILDKKFELCPFMQTVKPHENHAKCLFFLTHTQSPEIINFDIFLPYQNSPDIMSNSGTSIYLTLKNEIT